jgi:hypothetical protein
MDHAQTRLLEIRTSLPAENTRESARDEAMIANLEAQWRM